LPARCAAAPTYTPRSRRTRATGERGGRWLPLPACLLRGGARRAGRRRGRGLTAAPRPLPLQVGQQRRQAVEGRARPQPLHQLHHRPRLCARLAWWPSRSRSPAVGGCGGWWWWWWRWRRRRWL
jgi:hypothetical protein